MKESYSEGEEDQFFDTREDISSVSGWSSDCSHDFSSSFMSSECVSGSLQYDIWTANPQSVRARRSRFFKWMGVSLDDSSDEVEELENENSELFKMGSERDTEESEAVMKISYSEDTNLWSQSSMSSQLNEDTELTENSNLAENMVYRIKNLNDGTGFIVDELGQDGMLKRLEEVVSNRSLSIEEFHINLGSSSFVQQLMRRKAGDEVKAVENAEKKLKRGWFRRLGCAARIFERRAAASRKPCDRKYVPGTKMQRVRVHSSKKRPKELSSLFSGQDFLAHEGSILTMKFSLDGQYLASAGEDGVVRIWKVIEDENSVKLDASDSDSSCLLFKMDHSSKIAPLDVDALGKMKGLTRYSDLACVVLPPKVFRILEKPLHEFWGHDGEILDLSWSRKGYLLSSSIDNTVRLWQVGCDGCLGIFCHNNYVTSVHFNPVDENFFISGSIDGKVRIWEVTSCRVADYIDIREIVTAVCYHPDGKGGIVGTLTGNCRFYDIIDNQLQLHTEISLQGKKKASGKRITGFQFSPADPGKVIVTSADSVVRVVCGVDVICKLKGLRSAGCHMFASFTSDGRHILSVSEDCNVCVWNYPNQDWRSAKTKNITSCEHFSSPNSLLAIPWYGMKSTRGTYPFSTLNGSCLDGESERKMPLASPDFFSLTCGFLLDSLLKGPATWPEEKLPASNPGPVPSTICKIGYKCLKNACSTIFGSPHMWGLVIVTAGLDGRIRTYHNYGLPSCRR